MKLFLLTLCSWFLFLWLGNAQSWVETDSHIKELNINMDKSDDDKKFESDSLNNSRESLNTDINYVPNELKIDCYGWISVVVWSQWLLMLVWLILILLSLCAIPLYKKFKGTNKNSHFFCLPLLNIYLLFKITVGKVRFYYVIVYLLFLGCIIVYDHVIHGICYDNEEIIRYTILTLLIWGLSSIIILSILWIKLIFLYKKDSDKEHSDK